MIRRTQDACWSRGWGAAVLLATLVASCATPSIDPTLPLIAPGRVLELPQPGDLGRSIEAAQLVTVHRDGESFAFEGHVSVTPERFQLVGVDGMGRRALTVTWDKSGAVHAQKADWLPDVVAPGPMLADLVVLYWPEPVVRDALTGAGAELLVRDGSRSVVIDGVETFRADYGAGALPSWSGRLHYRNRAWGYEIDVQSVELAP